MEHVGSVTPRGQGRETVGALDLVMAGGIERWKILRPGKDREDLLDRLGDRSGDWTDGLCVGPPSQSLSPGCADGQGAAVDADPVSAVLQGKQTSR